MSSDAGIWTGHAYIYGPDDDGTGFGIIIEEAPAQMVHAIAGSTLLFTTTEPANGHTVRWDFGDGTTDQCKTGEVVEHTYATDGDFKVSAQCHQMVTTTSVVAVPGPDPVTQSAFSSAYSSAFS